MAVLILSDRTDLTTCQVMDWLWAKGHDFVRAGISELHRDSELVIDFDDGTTLLHNGQRIGCIWFRRNDDDTAALRTMEGKNQRRLEQRKIEEARAVNSILDCGDVPWLSYPRSEGINKLEVLRQAKSVGLNIPPTVVTNTKSVLVGFIEQHGRAVAKAATENLTITDMSIGRAYHQPVVLLDIDDASSISSRFYTTVFQKFIDKQYDIRTFFLDGKFYSMAIFSPSHDYRENYMTNRNVPYILPSSEQELLLNLMHKMGLNTGSIDMVMGKDGLYYFLEVNPNGQFGDVSQACNYYLEREIADWLSKNDLAYE